MILGDLWGERERRKEDAKGNPGWMRRREGWVEMNNVLARLDSLCVFTSKNFFHASLLSLTVWRSLFLGYSTYIHGIHKNDFFLSSLPSTACRGLGVVYVVRMLGWGGCETMFTWPACLSCSSLCSSYLSLSFLLFILCCLSILHSTLNFYLALCKTNFQLSICCSSHSSRFLLHSVTQRSKWKINTRRKVGEALVKQNIVKACEKRAVQWSAGEEKKVRKIARGCWLKWFLIYFV